MGFPDVGGGGGSSGAPRSPVWGHGFLYPQTLPSPAPESALAQAYCLCNGGESRRGTLSAAWSGRQRIGVGLFLPLPRVAALGRGAEYPAGWAGEGYPP